MEFPFQKVDEGLIQTFRRFLDSSRDRLFVANRHAQGGSQRLECVTIWGRPTKIAESEASRRRTIDRLPPA